LFVILAFAALAGSSTVSPPGGNDTNTPAAVEFAQLVIERRTVIRISPAPPEALSLPKSIKWKEKKAPKCISTNLLVGSMISKRDAVDLYLRGGQLMRAQLEKGCASIDFYSGFYLKPSPDGRICQDRDKIHSRTGDACQIEKFKTLVPAK
jgi:hypothetical protein